MLMARARRRGTIRVDREVLLCIGAAAWRPQRQLLCDGAVLFSHGVPVDLFASHSTFVPRLGEVLHPLTANNSIIK